MNTKGLSDFFAANWKFVAGLLTAVVVVLAVAGFWNHRGQVNEREATNMLYDAQVASRVFVAEKNIAEAEKSFQSLVEKFPKSRATYEAHLQMGDLLMEAGNPAEAMKRYEKAASIAGDSFSKLLARYNLGIAREQAGQYQEAVASYADALTMEGSDFLKPEILMAQARCFEALKQVAKAIEIYQSIQKDFANRSYYSGAASAYEKQLTSGSQQ